MYGVVVLKVGWQEICWRNPRSSIRGSELPSLSASVSTMTPNSNWRQDATPDTHTHTHTHNTPLTLLIRQGTLQRDISPLLHHCPIIVCSLILTTALHCDTRHRSAALLFATHSPIWLQSTTTLDATHLPQCMITHLIALPQCRRAFILHWLPNTQGRGSDGDAGHCA